MKIKIKKKNLKESLGDYQINDIKVKVLTNDSSGYESLMTIDLGDRIITQNFSILKSGTYVNRDSEAMKELERCYPAKFSDYSEEMRKLKPWNINGVANSTPNRNNVTKFHRNNDAAITSYDIGFEIVKIQRKDNRTVPYMPFDDGIFGSNTRAALSFFREVMHQIGEYVKQNPWLIYVFGGLDTDEEERQGIDLTSTNKRTRLYLTALKRLQRGMPGEWIVTRPDKGDANQIIFFRCPMGGMNEVSSMAGGAVQGFGAPFTKEEEELIQEMYSSAAIMGSGSGRIPAERSPEAHKRYVRIRFTRQGLQNFKPNRYFKENK